MIFLLDTNSQEMNAFGHQLLNESRTHFQSFEELSQMITESIYNEFRQADGQRIFALTRIFRLWSAQELADYFPEYLVDGVEHYLVLMGTVGVEPQWCDRRFSRYHQIIPVDANMSDMFRVMLTQIGVPIPELGIESSVVVEDSEMRMAKVFHVYDAFQSPAIPDKYDFVEPYQIQSVIGIGSAFLSGSAFFGVCFSTVPLDKEDVNKCAELVPYLATMLAICESQGAIWKM